MRRPAALLALALAAPLLLSAPAQARKATPSERAAMLAAWNADSGFHDPPRCRATWVTRVSAHRPRIGAVWANVDLRTKRGCDLGNGYAILRRPTRASTAWRVIFQGSEAPPCRLVTARMAKELGLGLICAPG